MVNPTIIRGAWRMTKVYIVLGEDAKHIHSVLSEDKVPTCFQYPTKYRGANHENVLSEDSEQVTPVRAHAATLQYFYTPPLTTPNNTHK